MSFKHEVEFYWPETDPTHSVEAIVAYDVASAAMVAEVIAADLLADGPEPDHRLTQGELAALVLAAGPALRERAVEVSLDNACSWAEQAYERALER